MNALSQALTERMQAQGMNQKMLAAASELSRSAISQYCSGALEPTNRTLERLAEALQCTPDDLTGDGPPPDPDYERDVPVWLAAQLLGKPEQFVRNALIQGTAPFGFAVKGNGQYAFSISPYQLQQYTGKEVSV